MLIKKFYSVWKRNFFKEKYQLFFHAVLNTKSLLWNLAELQKVN